MGGAQADDLHAPPSRLTALCPRARPSFGEGLPGRTAKAIIKLLAPPGGKLGRAGRGWRRARRQAGDVGEGASTKAGARPKPGCSIAPWIGGIAAAISIQSTALLVARSGRGPSCRIATSTLASFVPASCGRLRL